MGWQCVFDRKLGRHANLGESFRHLRQEAHLVGDQFHLLRWIASGWCVSQYEYAHCCSGNSGYWRRRSNCIGQYCHLRPLCHERKRSIFWNNRRSMGTCKQLRTRRRRSFYPKGQVRSTPGSRLPVHFLTLGNSWRWCFYINLPLDGLAFVIILFVLDLHTPKTPLRQGLKAVDWLGSLAMTAGTVMLLLGLEFGGVTFPWDSATVLCLIIFGLVTIALFFCVEKFFAPYPLMPLNLFSKRSNLAALGVCFFHAYVFISGSYFLPLYFQAVLGATPILSGVYLLPTALSLSFLSAFTGVFIRKTGQYLPPIWFGLVFMTAGFGLFINLDANSSWSKIIIYQIIAGIGVGPNFQSPLIALQSLVPVRSILIPYFRGDFVTLLP